MSDIRLGGNTFGFFYYKGHGFWFRVFGVGLSVETLKDHRPFFSERYGKIPAWHGLGFCWRILT